MTDRKQTVVKALRKLEKDWPKGLWLFATGNNLHLMSTHPDGTRHIPGRRDSGMDPELIVASFKIPSDGGDW